MDIFNKMILLVLVIVLAGLLGCQKNDNNAPPPPAIEELPKKDFGHFLPLKSEVLVKERTSSLVKFVKYKDNYRLGFYDTIEVTLSVFLSDTGDADVYAYWVYPEYLKSGGKIVRTSESVHSMTWKLVEGEKLVVGEELVVFEFIDEDGSYSGAIRPIRFNPPPLPGGAMVPEYRRNSPLNPFVFQVVTERLEAEVVDAIF